MQTSLPLWKRALREPLVQFAVPAALLFLLDASTTRAEGPSIRVTPAAVAALEGERETVLGRPLDEVERDALVEQFVTEEILLNEARLRGLDRRDGKLREHLVNKMRFLLEEDAPEPTAEELAQQYRDHPERYSLSPSLTLEHAFFEGTGPLEGEAVLHQLESGAAPESLGDPFYLGARIGYVTAPELAAVLGADFARSVDGLEAGVWVGPVRSARGRHFVRVVERHPQRLLPFESVEVQVREQWRGDWSEGRLAARIDELRPVYRVDYELSVPVASAAR